MLPVFYSVETCDLTTSSLSNQMIWLTYYDLLLYNRWSLQITHERRLIRNFFHHAAKRTQAGCGSCLSTFCARMQIESHILLLGKQPALTRLEETQIKSQLGAWAIILQLIKHFFIVNRSRAFGERTFFIDIFNAAQKRVSGHLAFVEAAQRLDLARQAIGRGKNRTLSK